jgi:hypothetical protein
MANAQVTTTDTNTDTEVNFEDYQKYLEGKLKVEFREKVIKSMELTEDEIVGFDPIFRDYMEDRKSLVEEKYKLIEEYEDEMAEDNSAESEDEETAGFIENYWELDIKEMELQKDFFDRFEDVVSTDKAINFFLMEDDMINQMMRPTLIRVVPMIVEYGPINDKDYDYDQNKNYDQDKMKEEKKDTSSYDNDSSYMEQSDADDKDTWSNDRKTDVTARNPVTEETENEVEEAAETAWDETKSAAKKVGEKTESAWNETKEEVEEVGNEIESEVNEAETAMTTTETDDMDRDDDDEWTERSATNTTSMKDEDDKVTAYSNWVKEPNGEVSLSHQYTRNGLNHLVNAVWTVAEKNDIDVSDWESKKARILEIADEITVDMYSTDHADLSREAFIMIADMIETIQNKAFDSDAANKLSSDVASAARALDPDVLMTPQAKKIHTFFEHANEAVTTMSRPVTADKKAEESSAYNK